MLLRTAVSLYSPFQSIFLGKLACYLSALIRIRCGQANGKPSAVNLKSKTALFIIVGLLIRALLSKLNLLLVPRISAVVIVVILLMQSLTIFGYQLKIDIASSAVFFPIIITAWIIERASITWEEDGPVNATREIIFSILVAIITYFVICNNYIRHIMFAFNELNLVILFIVMLLGTYTGYRLTELKRFSPLAKKG